MQIRANRLIKHFLQSALVFQRLVASLNDFPGQDCSHYFHDSTRWRIGCVIDVA